MCNSATRGGIDNYDSVAMDTLPPPNALTTVNSYFCDSCIWCVPVGVSLLVCPYGCVPVVAT